MKSRAVIAGLAYFAWVFAFAFAVGVLRVLVLAPRLGEVGAVLVELPLVLAVSWWSCGVLVRRFAVATSIADRLIMGGTAFLVLQIAEALLAVFAFGRTPSAYLVTLVTPVGLIGLSGQIVFALIPLVRRRR